MRRDRGVGVSAGRRAGSRGLRLPLSGYLVDVMEGRPLLIRRALGPLRRSTCRLVGARGRWHGLGFSRQCALAFTAVSFIGLFILLICQGTAPWNPRGFPGLRSIRR